MKKRLFVLTVLGMAAAMPLSAAADAAFMKVSTIKNGRLVNGTNLFRVQGPNGYGLVDLNGNALTGTIYGNNFYFEDNFITVSEYVEGINHDGILDLNGKTVVPFQYGAIDILSSRWALGIVLEEATSDAYDYESWGNDNKYYKISKVDIYYLGDGNGKCLASLERSQFMEARAYGEYISVLDRSTTTANIYDSAWNQVASGLRDTYEEPEGYKEIEIYSENGQQGLKDAEGNVIMEPAFRYINEGNGPHLTVSTGEKEGLIDIQGNIILDAQFDDIASNYYGPSSDGVDGQRSYVAAGYVAFYQDGKLGYADVNGNITCQPKYAKDNVEVNGASSTLTDLEGNTIIVAGDGVETVIADYEVHPLYYGSGMFYGTVDDDYNYGLIDWHGQELFPCEYSGIELTGDGKYVYVETDYESGDLYQLTYPEATGAETAAPEEAGTEAAAVQTETAAADTETQPAAPAATEAQPSAPETEAQQAPATDTNGEADAPQTETAPAENGESASSETAAVISLLDNAVTLLNAQDYASAESMINSAKTLLGEGKDAAVLLDSALTLLKAETVDANSVAALLTSAKALL